MNKDADNLGTPMPELPKHAEWRSWYRHKALDWLMTESGYLYEGVDKCIQDLEEDASCREAAVALFWIVYLDDKEPLCLKEAQIERIEAIMDRGIHDAGKDEMQHRAFVKLHLAGTLAVSLIRPGVQLAENPRAVKAIEGVEAASDALAWSITVEDPCFWWGRERLDDDLLTLSVALVSGIAALELALWRDKEERYEDALNLMDVAVDYLYLTRFQSDEPPDEEERKMSTSQESGTLLRFTFHPSQWRHFAYLPHSPDDWYGFDPQDASRIFEGLKGVDRDKVKDWGKVAKSCERIGDSGFMCDCQAVKDKYGNEWTPQMYWAMAAQFAECQMSSNQFLKAWEEKEQTGAEERLRRDFFDDVWENMPLKAREALIDAETQWCIKPRPSYDHMTTAYRKAVEQLLKTDFPFLAEKAKRKLDRNSMPWLPQGNLPTTFLGKMRIVLKHDPNVKNWIQEVLSQEADSSFLLILLPEHLKRLADVRNYYEHPDDYPDKAEKDIVEQAKKVRCNLLGVRYGEEVIRRLVEIKRAMDQKAARQSRSTP